MEKILDRIQEIIIILKLKKKEDVEWSKRNPKTDKSVEEDKPVEEVAYPTFTLLRK